MRYILLICTSLLLISCVKTEFAYKYRTEGVKSYVIKNKSSQIIQVSLTYTSTNYRVIIKDADSDFKSDIVIYIDKMGNKITQNREENPNLGFFDHADSILRSVQKKENDVKKKK